MRIFEKIIAGIALVCILAGIRMACDTYQGYKKGKDEYLKLQEDFVSKAILPTVENTGEKQYGQAKSEQENTSKPEQSIMDQLPEDAPERISVDFDGLKKINKDIVAWIMLPAVDLSYPVVQGADNEYYLHRSIEGEYLFSGCIFLDYFNNPDMGNYNTIIYGHNMRDGSMFAKLKDYADIETYQSCPYFWIYTPDADYLYKICSVHNASAGSNTYIVRFADNKTYMEWLDKMKNSSIIETGVNLKNGDRIVTLSTCTGEAGKRQVVQGVRIFRTSEREADRH